VEVLASDLGSLDISGAFHAAGTMTAESCGAVSSAVLSLRAGSRAIKVKIPTYA
jgi:hypothetical protein